MNKLAVLVLSLLIGIKVYAITDYTNPEKGLLWYDTFGEVEKKEEKKKVVEKKPEEKKPKKVVKKPEEKKKDFEFPIQPNTPPVIAKFLKEPTEENAKEFLKWQAKYFNHIKKVAYTLRNTYKKYGYEVYNVVGYPETPQFSDKYYGLLEKEFYKSIFEKFKGKLGLLFFYKSTCPFCVREIPVVESLMKDYGLSIRGVAYDKALNTSFPSVLNPYLFEKYGVTGTPYIVAVYTDKGNVIQGVVGVGYESKVNLLQNILYFLYSNNLIEERDLNPNYKYFYNSQARGSK